MGVMAATEAGLGNSFRIYLRSKSCRGCTMALSKASSSLLHSGPSVSWEKKARQDPSPSSAEGSSRRECFV